MTGHETPIELARRHVLEAEARVRRQRDIAERLRDNSLTAEPAQALLVEFQDNLEDHRRSLRRIEAEQRLGLRTDDGSLLPQTVDGVALISAEEVLESISDAFYAIDRQWRFTYVNRVAEAWWGRDRHELLGKSIWTEFPQAVGSATYKAHLTAADEGSVVRLEAVSPIVGHWIDLCVYPNARGLSVYFRDISERKHEEARQTLLVNELNHRVKNTLATVQAIATQSFKGKDVPPEARRGFMARLMALAEANDLVVKESWTGARILELVAAVVSPHAVAGETSHFMVDGPDLVLKPRAATSLALALHELATNSAKYGALSVSSGSISLGWEVVDPADAPNLLMTWRESGGPRVETPTRSGFGTRLLREGLRVDLLAQVDLRYPSSGFVCTLKAPMSEVAAARV